MEVQMCLRIEARRLDSAKKLLYATKPDLEQVDINVGRHQTLVYHSDVPDTPRLFLPIVFQYRLDCLEASVLDPGSWLP